MRELRECRSKKLALDRMREHLAVLDSAATATVKPISPAPGSGGRYDSMERLIAKIADLRSDYITTIVSYECAVKMAEKAVEALKEPYRTLMQLRYIEGLKWEQIAEKMNYTEKHCYKLHRKAIYMLAQMDTK